MKRIWLAGGCFWGVEAYFRQLKGVVATQVGYGQGGLANPSYEEVCRGQTGHAEICEVVYDETVLSLQQVLEHFLRIIDPTTLNRQGPDSGSQYRSGIYCQEPQEQRLIGAFLAAQQRNFTSPIVVEVELLRSFYAAEEYHQRYLEKNPRGYCHVDLSRAAAGERK